MENNNLTPEQIKMIQKLTAKKHKKKLEFSKMVMFFVMISAFVIMLYSMAIIWVTKDLSALPTLITGVLAFSATGVSFYSLKAGAENIQKIKNGDSENY